MIEIQSPAVDATESRPHYSIFLAGSIEMDTAEEWQRQVIQRLADDNITIYNPRRKEWDSSWKQEITESNFEGQVMWELNHMNKADAIVMYFDPRTKSPITLLELGLYADGGKLIVCCPPGFWRKGNVDIVCREYDIKQVESIDEMCVEVRRRLAIRDQMRKVALKYVSEPGPIMSLIRRLERHINK